MGYKYRSFSRVALHCIGGGVCIVSVVECVQYYCISGGVFGDNFQGYTCSVYRWQGGQLMAKDTLRYTTLV